MMDNTSLFGDTFSSLEDERILDIKRPSLISLSSDEFNFINNNNNNNGNNGNVVEVDTDGEVDAEEDKIIPVLSSTPYFSKQFVNRRFQENEDPYGLVGSCRIAEDDSYLTKDIKRLSLSVFNDTMQSNAFFGINKSVSLHDISSIRDAPMARATEVPSTNLLLRRDITYSTETLQSNSAFTTKSKDSGFQRSTSCTSITTTTNSSKKYDHVPSKVKQYIQNIKQTEALNKMKKQLHCFTVPLPPAGVSQSMDPGVSLNLDNSSPCSDSLPFSKKELLTKVKELEEEIKERDDVIDQLAKDHTELKLKYAAAANRIDDLRIKISCINKQPVMVNEDKLIEMLETTKTFSNDTYLKDANNSVVIPASANGSSLTSEPVDRVRNRATANGSVVEKCRVFTPSNAGNSPNASRKQNVLKSFSCKQMNVTKPTIKKSATNVDSIVTGPSCDIQETCFDKVERWQKSLAWTDAAIAKNVHGQKCPIGGGSHCESDDKALLAATKDTQTKVKKYRKKKERCNSIGSTEKFLVKSGEGVNSNPTGPASGISARKQTEPQPQPQPMMNDGRKLVRSVSLVSYDDSSVSNESSLADEQPVANGHNMMDCDDNESSDGSTGVSGLKHERYRDFKQRRLSQKCSKLQLHAHHPSVTDTNFDIVKAHSASNLNRTFMRGSANNKRTSDVKSSCSSSCSPCNGSLERLHVTTTNAGSSGCRPKSKYLKLNEEKNPIIKCKTVDFYGKKVNHRELVPLSGEKQHSASPYPLQNVAAIPNGVVTKHANKIKECRCLYAFEKLQTEGKERIEKFAQRVSQHDSSTKRYKEKDIPNCSSCK